MGVRSARKTIFNCKPCEGLPIGKVKSRKEDSMEQPSQGALWAKADESDKDREKKGRQVNPGPR